MPASFASFFAASAGEGFLAPGLVDEAAKELEGVSLAA